ncbi:hypothetical protein M407DRAFT_14828 [Tulasnella calospora MUT 4182]|uniref:GST N-terminal domain-containing protein n=1 Tax=Tulasnella calospora MUT 4182 TaxID=1051891 RepID=A0A0C3QM44_9AGAM|nr:hypothetical protein M407DRAFT_14828 [Tulasnella calospora MUT 4182]
MATAGHPGPIPKAALYYHPKDPWSSAVLLALEEKGYGNDELDRKEVDVVKGDNYDLAYLRINSSAAGTGVPTLVVPLDRYLGAEIESKYKAISDVSKILEFLDKSRTPISKQGTISHSPAPALAPATIDAQSKSNTIISLVHSTPLDLELLSLAGKTPEEVAELAKGEQGTWLKRRAEKLAAALAHDPTAASPDPNNPAPVLTAKSRALLEPRLALYKTIGVIYDSPTAGDAAAQDFFNKSKTVWEVDVKAALEMMESTIKQSHVASGEEGINATGTAVQDSATGHVVSVAAANDAAAEAESHNREAQHPGGLLLGEQLCLADLHLFVWLAHAVHLSRGDLSPGGIDKLGERTGAAIPPRVKAFWEAMVPRESVKKVYPDGAH